MAITNFFILLLLLLTVVVTTVPRQSLGATTAAQFLASHNSVRSRLGVPPLRWSRRLEGYARWYANQRRRDCALIHSSSNYGENLFWGKGKKWRISDAVRAWSAQRQNYDYGRNKCRPGMDCLHYTQMVWRTTRFVGCARIVCSLRDTYMACEYDPHGNVIGQRPY